MPDPNHTPENIEEYLSSVVGSVDRQLQETRQALRQAIADLDAAIVEKTNRLTGLERRSVTRADATALVAKNMRDSLKAHRLEMRRRAARAGYLSSHVPVSNFGTIDGTGRHKRSRSEPKRLDILPHNLSATDLAAILLDDEAIDAFAADAIESTDAPAQGAPVAELAAEADALADELDEMHKRRHELRERLSNFINMALSPVVPDSFFQRSSKANVSPSPEPKVTQFDESGNIVKTRHGHTFDELLRYRADSQLLPQEPKTYHILNMRDPAMDGDQMPGASSPETDASSSGLQAVAHAADFLAELEEDDLADPLPQGKGAELSGGSSV